MRYLVLMIFTFVYALTPGQHAESKTPQQVELDSKLQALVQNVLAKDKLYEGFWVNNKLKPELRKNLLAIARIYISDLGLKNVVVKDIVFAGSMAGYLYHDKSDIDIHVAADASKLSNNKSLIFQLFRSKSKYWNYRHNFNMMGRNVELFMWDTVTHFEGSKGIYSLITERWTSLPVKPTNTIDQKKVLAEVKHYAARFNKLNQAFKDDPKGMDCNLFARLNKDLSKFRGRGFETTGEYSIENLAYKTLRNGGYLLGASELNTRCYETQLNLP